MNSRSSCEIELELTPDNKPRSRQLSLFVMLALLMYTVAFFDYCLPIPLGMCLLYLFRNFKELAVKALILADIVDLITTVSLFNVLMLGGTLLCFIVDLGFCYIFVDNGYEFTDKTIKDSSWLVTVLSFLVMIPIFLSLPIPSMESYLWYLTEIGCFVVMFIASIYLMARSFNKGFKKVAGVLDNIYDMDKVKLM